MTRAAKTRLFGIAFAVCVIWFFAALSSNGQAKLTSRILLIPLDDRPPCLQMPVKMGLIGDAEVVAPPRAMLGRFTDFGKSDEIVEWIRKQDLKKFDAAIVSVDMLAYGGLVAMREYETTAETALKRLEIIRTIRKSAPKMPIYGSSVIMRLAPTGNIINEAYRVNLARWAEISADPSKAQETAELEKKIPAEALEKYKKARERDLKINLHTVDLVREGVIDYLILSQDDAKPNGVHIADREKLIAKVTELKLQEKIAVQPGADEVSMLLLSRALTAKYKYRPKIKAIFSDEKLADQAMPYEDRPLRQTVSFHIKAAGGVEVADEKDAEILLFVFVSRFEKGAAEKFADRIASVLWEQTGPDTRRARSKRPGLIVADVDPKGDVQGADPAFTKELKSRLMFETFAGYASWNTAGNTIGTALPYGLTRSLESIRMLGFPLRGATEAQFRVYHELNGRRQIAHTWFLLNRILDDFVYHSVVRPKAIKLAQEKGWNPFRFTPEQQSEVEKYAFDEISKSIRESINGLEMIDNYFVCEHIGALSFKLPWGRTFEAEIDFDLKCIEK